MPHYQYDISITRQKRFIRRFKKLLITLAGAAVIVAVILGIDSFRQATKDNSSEGSPSTSVVRPSVREFDTDYFSFTAPNGWQNIKAESSAQVYVYRSYRGALVENELKIYVNSNEADSLDATRILPVKIDASTGHIIPSQISDHCSVPAGAASSRAVVTIEGISFHCRTDDTNYTVLVGEKGGTTILHLKSGNNSTVNFSFLYRSSTTPPETSQLIDILNSFDTI